jgi:glycogen operon protein
MSKPPLLQELAFDPILGNVKLIAEAWDAGGMYQVGDFSSSDRWAEWNGRYRDCLRRFIKGGAEHAPELYRRIRGSEDLYDERNAASSINFVTCHDGFTLFDLVSYNEKHNEMNGEDNRDGCNDNDSWNCGAEGSTQDPQINDLRMRQMKNMLTILLTSRGVPMLLSGDEFANTQYGNNNAYCQDNEISWLNWERLAEYQDLFGYVKKLNGFRMEHPVLRAEKFDYDRNKTGYPELSFHGTKPWELDMSASNLVFAYLFAEDHEKYGTKKDAFLYIAVNAHWEPHEYQLPVLPEKMKWYREAYTGEAYADGESGTARENEPEDLHSVTLMARSCMILVGRD